MPKLKFESYVAERFHSIPGLKVVNYPESEIRVFSTIRKRIPDNPLSILPSGISGFRNFGLLSGIRNPHTHTLVRIQSRVLHDHTWAKRPISGAPVFGRKTGVYWSVGCLCPYLGHFLVNFKTSTCTL